MRHGEQIFRDLGGFGIVWSTGCRNGNRITIMIIIIIILLLLIIIIIIIIIVVIIVIMMITTTTIIITRVPSCKLHESETYHAKSNQ